MGTKTYNNYEDLITFTRASGGHALRPVSYGDELVDSFDSTSFPYETFTSSGNTITSAINTTSFGIASVDIAFETGRLYLVSGSITLNSGTGPDVRLGINDSLGQTTLSSNTSGSFSKAFVAGNETHIGFRNASNEATNFSATLSVKEVMFDESGGTLTLFEHPNNVPRVEYDAAGNRLGLLVEESRTNLIPSSDVEDWTNVSGGTTSPVTETTLGALTGKTVISQGQIWHRATSPPFSATSGTTYTVTAFYKAGTSGQVYIDFRIPTNSSVIKGNVGSLSASSNAAGTATILSQETLPQGVYKVVFTVVANATASNCIVGIGPHSTTSGATVIALAAQVEQASFGTSYIKTKGATATRSADVASIPVADFGYNSAKGTVVCKFSFNYEDGGSGFPRPWEIGNTNSVSERINVYISEASGALVGSVITNNVGEGNVTLKTGLSGSVDTTVALAWAKDNMGGSDDGDSTVVDPAVNVLPTGVPRNVLSLKQTNATTANINGHIKYIKYYPRRLTNAQLEDLSS